MVESPDLPLLPYRMENGVKCFELIAGVVQQELLPGVFMQGYGYNGSIPGPTIVVETGDLVQIRVINRLPEATSAHWHGLDVPNAMDGVPPFEPSPLIQPGYGLDYRFRIMNPPGTHMYHSHYETIRGRWPFHCHIPHHTSNNFTLPAGGMFTTIQVGD